MQAPDMIFGIGVPGVIVGLMQIVKGIGVPGRLIPIVSLCLGMLMAYMFRGQLGMETAQTILTGLYWGLVPVGAYSGTKNVVQHFTK